MTVHGMCSLELSVHGLVIHIDTVVVDLNCQAILGMDILGDATKLPFILDLVDGTLSGGTKPSNSTGFTRPRNVLPKHQTLCASHHTQKWCCGPSWKLTMVDEVQTFVQELGILVGRSLVRADADDWKIPILLYNSDPCTKKSKDCKCNPVINPSRTRIVRV